MAGPGHLVETITMDLIEDLTGPPDALFTEEERGRATSLEIWRSDPDEPAWTEFRLVDGFGEFARTRLPGE